jgi:hypothetical protein
MGEGRQSNADTPNEIPLPVPEAAEALGISPEAVRNRLSRGTLRSEKRGGRVFVLIDRDMVRPTERHTGDTPNDTTGLIDALRQQIASLERQLEVANEANREHRRIIAGLVQRIPELEAPQEPRDEPQTPRQDAGGVEDRGEASEPQTGAETARRPWWMRIFGG